MKKIVMMAAVVLAGAMAFGGAANDVLVSFSTQGPDTYADGSVVMDGECYALVWTKDGAAFGGFASDGTLLSKTDKFVLVAGLAKDGKCPSMLFEIAAKDAEAYRGGTFGLYVLDTRVKNAKGEVSVGGAGLVASLAPKALNAAAKVSGKTATAGEGATIAGGATALAAVDCHVQVAEPTITGFKVEGAKITLTVNAVDATLDYFIVPGKSPTLFHDPVAMTPNGNTFTFEAKKDQTFFRVKGVPKFK